MERNLTCIVCPMGCPLKVELCENEVKNVSGNTCKRGEEYARTECTNPVRVVTSTIRTTDGRVVAVKTDKPIPKNKVFECMKMINKATAVLPISVGDVIIEDVFGSNVVAVCNME